MGILPFLLGLDSKTLMRGSRIRIGKRVRIQGAPALLIGVACVVAAGGGMAVLQAAAPRLPDTLREAGELWKTVRGDRSRRLPA